ncbi:MULTISPECIES: hypothetical protein [unclassified Streptomyces]|uniref:hypothetical protein n=1 Tax=unclassified Streptomyces TaxID=2593676 RepID=UPI00068FAAC1|nr:MULTISPECIES: hypothetical protein [unclassified Streptomyces]
MRRPYRALAPALLLALTGCGVTDTAPGPAGSPAAGLPGRTSGTTAAVHVYFYSAQGLERVSRLYRGPDPLGAALRHLVQGPDPAERARGLVSYAPGQAPTPVGAADGPGTVRLHAPRGWESRSALRQLVCTAADAVAPAGGTGLGNVRVTVERTATGDTVTQVCLP